MTETMIDILRGRAERICRDGTRLLGQFSGMHPVNRPDSPFEIVSPSGDQSWNDLPTEGKQIQTQLLPYIIRFTDIVCTLTQDLPSNSQHNLEYVLKEIRRAVEQNGRTFWKTNDEAVKSFRELVNQLITTLQDYYVSSSDVAIAIPDTNAFLGKLDIEHWKFKDVNHFTIILTPTVLSELDKLKNNHSNQSVRDKAKDVIRRIKEYRRRGNLNEGVVIVKGCISLKSIASEPKLSRSLSWLDPNNADDRFLSTTLEIIRSNLGSIVFIVTSDINLHNKAEMAGIPFHEVPTQITVSSSKSK
jgi:rRNA-processing protein FCF1